MDAQGPSKRKGPPTPIMPVAAASRSRRLRILTAVASVVLAVAVVHSSVPNLSAVGFRGPAPTASARTAGVQQAAPATPGRPERNQLVVRRPDPGTSLPTAVRVSLPAVKLGPPASVVFRVHTSEKVIALTFDDGWNPKAGRAILDTLVRLHVEATFFVNAIYVRRDPDLWRDIAAAGFPIGNHTYDHRNLTTLSYGFMLAELQKDASVFHRLTGSTLAPIVRPPYGARNRIVDAAAFAAGFPTEVLWDTVAGDTATTTDRQIIANASAGRPGSIVLLHVGPTSTPRVLAAVIAAYRARGFTFVTIPELLALPT